MASPEPRPTGEGFKGIFKKERRIISQPLVKPALIIAEIITILYRGAPIQSQNSTGTVGTYRKKARGLNILAAWVLIWYFHTAVFE